MVKLMFSSLHHWLNFSEVKFVPASLLKWRNILKPFLTMSPLHWDRAIIVDSVDLSGRLILSRYLETGSPRNKKSFALHSLAPLKTPVLGTQLIKICSHGTAENLIFSFDIGCLGEIAILHLSHQLSPLKISFKSSHTSALDADIKEEIALWPKIL